MTPSLQGGEKVQLHERPSPMVMGKSLRAVLDVGAAASPSELLSVATREITELLGERGSCIFLEGTPRILLAPHAPEVVGQPVHLERYPEIIAAVHTQDLVEVEDVRRDGLLSPVRALLPRTLGAVVAVPLTTGQRCCGVFLVQSSEAHQVSAEAKATAVLVARLAAELLARGAPGPDQLLRSVAREASARTTVTQSGRIIAPPRILIVEDDSATSVALADLLEGEGYIVQRAADGREAVSRAVTTKPDLVLLDVTLPFLDGYEAAAQLRLSLDVGDVPIIFLSGSHDLSSRVRGLNMEGVDFLRKPYSVEELLARIERSLSGANAWRALQDHADHDELTGLANLRLLRTRIADEHARFSRYGSPLSLAMIDVDKLKRINDQHGHLMGSEVLRAVGDTIRRVVRVTDLPARYGGDEFVVLLPQTLLPEASAFAQRVLEHVARRNPGGHPVTVSIGVASLSRPGTVESDDHLLRRADAAAYAAKRAGGNQVALDDQE